MKNLSALSVLILFVSGSLFCAEYQDQFFDGIATHYYDANVTYPACGFPWPGEDAYYCALNSFRLHYNGDSAIGCGSFVQVEYKGKQILAHVIDECPYPVSDSSLGCWNTEHMDLSKAAFSSLEDLNTGIIEIKWRIVPHDLAGPIEYHYHDSASQWWLALQIRNHSQGIKKLELKLNGDWKSLERTSWNYFVYDGDAGSPPYSFRVTSIEYEILEDNAISFGGGKTIKGAKNFSVTEIKHKPYDFKINACAKKSISTFTTIDNALYLDNNFIKEIERVEIYSISGKKLYSFKPAAQLSIAKSSGIKIVKLYYRN